MNSVLFPLFTSQLLVQDWDGHRAMAIENRMKAYQKRFFDVLQDTDPELLPENAGDSCAGPLP